MNKSDLKILLTNIKSNEHLNESEINFLKHYYYKTGNKKTWSQYYYLITTNITEYNIQNSNINMIFKEVKKWDSYFDNFYYKNPTFLFLFLIFCDIEESNKKIYNDLIYINRNSYLDEIPQTFEMLDEVINFYYKCFNNNKKIIMKLDNYNNILTKVKMDTFKKEFKKYIKKAKHAVIDFENKNLKMDYEEKNETFMWMIEGIIDFFDYLYKNNMINEEFAKAYFNKVYKKIKNNAIAKNRVFYICATKCSDDFKELLIKNYFDDISINELLNPNNN